MKWKRWIKRGLFALPLGIAGGALVLHFFVVPRVIRAELDKFFHDAGLTDYRFDLPRATLWGTEVKNLTVGPQAVVASVVVDYRPSILWTGAIDRIRVANAQVRVDLADGAVHAGPLEGLWKRPATNSSTTRPSGVVSFPPIVLESSRLVLSTPQGEVALPLRATIAPQGADAIAITGSIGSETSPISVDAKIFPAIGTVTLRGKATRIEGVDLTRLFSGLLPATPVHIAGSVGLEYDLNWAQNVADAHVTIVPDAFSVAAGKGKSTNVNLTAGVLKADGHWADGKLNAALHVNNATVEMPANTLVADGVNGSLFLDSLSPLRSGGSELTVAGVKYGNLRMTDGRVAFAIDNATPTDSTTTTSIAPSILRIDKSKWSLFGGFIATDAITMNLDQPAFDLNVNVIDVDLAKILEEFAEKKATGQGLLDGNIRVRIDDKGFRIVEANLSADGRGRVQIADSETTGEAVLGPTKAGTREEQQFKADVVEAMGDFEYDVLRADVYTQDEKLVAYLHVLARGIRGRRQSIDYESHITGLEDALNLYLGLQDRVSKLAPK